MSTAGIHAPCAESPHAPRGKSDNSLLFSARYPIVTATRRDSLTASQNSRPRGPSGTAASACAAPETPAETPTPEKAQTRKRVSVGWQGIAY